MEHKFPGFYWFLILLWDVVEIVGCAPWSADLLGQLLELLYDERLTQRVAKFIYDILEVYNSVPMFIPPPYSHLPLTVA